MSEIITCENCGKTLVTNEINVYRDIPCPHCEKVASPGMKFKK